MNANLVHIDENRENFSFSMMARLHVHTELQVFFKTLNAAVADGVFQLESIKDGERGVLSESVKMIDSEKCFSGATPIKPQRLMHDLSVRLPENARVLLDAGNTWSWATHYLRTRNSEGHYRIGFRSGSMAWAIGAAVGTAL